MDMATLVTPWFELMREQIPGIELFDAHTHLGANDPDGMSQTPERLLDTLAAAHARGAFVFPMHEPGGYPPANDMVIAAAAQAGGKLTPFCRVDPNTGRAREEAERALNAGARGIKLHPRAEQFTLDHPALRELGALAHERRLPILIHAGRGIPALGIHAVQLAGEFPQARIILAHAGICDLSWIWRVAPDHPNLLFDTSWWMPADLQALFSLVPPGQILFASDAPYGAAALSAVFQMRIAQQAGLSAAQLRCIASEQSLRIAAGGRCWARGRPSASTSRLPTCCWTASPPSSCWARSPPCAATSPGPRCSPSLVRPARCRPRSTTRRCSRSSCSCWTPSTPRRSPTLRTAAGSAILILASTVARTPDVPVPAPR